MFNIVLIEFTNLFLSGKLIAKGKSITIGRFRFYELLVRLSRKKKKMYERFCLFFNKKIMFHSKQCGFRGKSDTIDASP